MTFSGYGQDVDLQEVESELDEMRLALSVDGERLQSQAVERLRGVLKRQSAELIERAASRSLAQQASDLTKGLVVVKRRSKAREGEPPPPNAEATPCRQAFNRPLGTIDKASKSSHMRLFARSPPDAQASFSVDNVQKGWRLAGAAPTPSARATLSERPGFRAVDSDQAEQLHDDALERLAPDAQRGGRCSPDLTRDAREEALDAEERELYKAAKEKALPSALNRWRRACVSHKGTIKRELRRQRRKSSRSLRRGEEATTGTQGRRAL